MNREVDELMAAHRKMLRGLSARGRTLHLFDERLQQMLQMTEDEKLKDNIEWTLDAVSKMLELAWANGRWKPNKGLLPYNKVFVQCRKLQGILRSEGLAQVHQVASMVLRLRDELILQCRRDPVYCTAVKIVNDGMAGIRGWARTVDENRARAAFITSAIMQDFSSRGLAPVLNSFAYDQGRRYFTGIATELLLRNLEFGDQNIEVLYEMLQLNEVEAGRLRAMKSGIHDFSSLTVDAIGSAVRSMIMKYGENV